MCSWKIHISTKGEIEGGKHYSAYHCVTFLFVVGNQCDLIGWFLKVFGNKSNPKRLVTFGLIWKGKFCKNCCGYYLGNFWKRLGNFLTQPSGHTVATLSRVRRLSYNHPHLHSIKRAKHLWQLHYLYLFQPFYFFLPLARFWNMPVQTMRQICSNLQEMVSLWIFRKFSNFLQQHCPTVNSQMTSLNSTQIL